MTYICGGDEHGIITPPGHFKVIFVGLIVICDTKNIYYRPLQVS